mgnify:CR=1 FL=1|tara:strand:- start:4009 stop:6102 length:2094 start_codon:yes stop_codon:yes gene_type:complete
MAETVAIKIEVDAGKSVQTLGKIEQEIAGVNNEMNELTEINQEFKSELIELERRFAKIPKTALQARKVVGDQLEDLKSAIKDNNLALENFRFKKKQLNDVRRDIKHMGNEFVESAENILHFGASIGEATAGFMLFAGASEESTENVEKAIGVALAFGGVARSISGAIKVWNETLKGNAVIQGIVTTATKMWSFVTKGATLVTKALRLALLSLPFVAIGVAIAGLIAYWDSLVSGIKSGLKWLGLYDDSEEKAQARAKARLKEERKLRKQRLEQLENSAKREQNIHDNRIANMDNEIRLAKAQGKNTVDLERQKLKAIIDSTKIQNELAEERIALQKQEINLEIARLEGLGSLVSGIQKADEKLVKLKQEILDLDQEQIESTQAIENAETDLLVFEVEAIKERRTKRKEESKEKEEQRKKEEQAIFDLLIARKEADAEDILDAREKAEALINIENLKLQKELENKELSDAEKELLEFEYQQRIADISQEFADMELEKEQAEAERLAEVQKENEEKDKEARDKKLEADKELAEKRIELEQQIQDESFNLALGGVDALLQLNDAFQGQTEAQQKKAFERNKKLQIAQALIGASQGVVNILANASTIPDPFGTIYKVGQLAILAGVTTAQIAKISQQQFSGGGSVSAPAISGGGGGAPSLGAITNTSTLTGQESQQVFVTETDITNTQNKVAVIENQATIK